MKRTLWCAVALAMVVSSGCISTAPMEAQLSELQIEKADLTEKLKQAEASGDTELAGATKVLLARNLAEETGVTVKIEDTKATNEEIVGGVEEAARAGLPLVPGGALILTFLGIATARWRAWNTRKRVAKAGGVA